MAKLQTNAECRVRIEEEDIAHVISSVRLDQYVDRHHELAVRLRPADSERGESEFGDTSAFSSYLGSSITLNIAPAGGMVDAARTLEFKGLVTEVRFESSVHETNIVTLVARSQTIKLDGPRRNAFHFDKKASEIIEELAGNGGMSCDVEATEGQMAYSVQYRETDYQYLMRLASANGLFAFYDNDQLRAVGTGNYRTVELQWRDSLGAFTVGVGTASQKSKVHGWDVEKKQALDGEESSSLGTPSVKASKDMFADTGFIMAAKASDQASIGRTAERGSKTAVGGMVVCSGESIVPELTMGCCAKVNGMDGLDGLYWIKSISHVIDESGKYHNEFKSTPVDMAFPGKVAARPPITDLQSALVVDNEDPDKLGRVKVRFPWDDSQDQTLWLRVMTPHAGNERGWYCIPEVDDEVLVGFEYGNPDLPIVLGSLFNGKDVPHGDAVKSGNEAKMFMTKGGNMISFGDGSGSEEIKISQGDGDNAIIIGMSGPSITIESSGDISIKGKTIALESTTGDITVKSAGAVKQESTADMEIKGGMNLKAEGSMNCELKGGVQTKLEGGAMVEVKGGLVKIN